MDSNLCEVRVLRSERCDAPEARDAVKTFLEKATSSSTTELRLDIVTNVRKVHAALESLANGDAPPMSPVPSLPDSLDGWLAAGKQSSVVSNADSLDGWLAEGDGIHRDQGKLLLSQPDTPTSHPVGDGTASISTLIRGEWRALTSVSFQQQGSSVPEPLVDKALQEASLFTQQAPSANGAKEEVDGTDPVGGLTEGLITDPKELEVPGKHKDRKKNKTKKRKKGKGKQSANGLLDLKESPSKVQMKKSKTEHHTKDGKHKKKCTKRAKLKGEHKEAV